MSFQLSVITPNGKIFEDQVEALRAPGRIGGFGILSGHAPIVSSLKAGVLKFSHNNQDQYYGIGPGILEVNHEHNVLILSETAQSASNHEEAQSQANELQNN